MGSELRCQSGGAEFVCLGVFVSQLGCILIGSSSPVSRSSSSSNYIWFLPSVLSGLAFLFLFWLGSATDHSTHTPTTTHFHYAYLVLCIDHLEGSTARRLGAISSLAGSTRGI